jgi:hypothetical protein
LAPAAWSCKAGAAKTYVNCHDWEFGSGSVINADRQLTRQVLGVAPIRAIIYKKEKQAPGEIEPARRVVG